MNSITITLNLTTEMDEHEAEEWISEGLEDLRGHLVRDESITLVKVEVKA